MPKRFVMSSRNTEKTRYIRAGEAPASHGNIANLVTLARILFAPVLIVLLLVDAGEHGVIRFVAGALFILGMATDGLDGSLARRRNLITSSGKILDPIADKVLIGGALITLSILGELWWWVTGLILLREVGITVWRLIIAKKRVVAASSGGKLKTVFQTMAISFYLVPLYLFLGPYADVMQYVNATLMGIAVALTLYSGAQYLWRNRRINSEAGNSPQDNSANDE